MLKASEGICRSLERRGAVPGDRVLVHLQDGPLLMASIAALEALRAVYVPVNIKLPEEQKANVLAISNPRFLLHDGTGMGRLAAFSTPVEPSPCDGLTLSTISNTRQGASLPRGGHAAHRLEEDFAVATTSATTGAAKAIVVNQFSTLATGYALAMALQLGPDDAILPMVPLTSHLNLCCSIPASFLTGSPLLLPGSGRNVYAALPWALERGVGLLVGVPTNYLQLVQSIVSSSTSELNGLRAIVAGSVCNESVLRLVRERLGIALCNHYGMSEFGGVSSVCLDDREENLVYCSTGRPFPWVEARITGTGSEASELLVRGPGLFRSSLTNLAEMEKRVSPEGWLHTGDFGTIGPSGEIRVAGRAGDMAIRCGNNVFFAEIEATFRESSEVGDVVAFSLPDPVLGEAICACIIPANGTISSVQDMFSFAAGRLPFFKLPDYLTFRAHIETNLNGKVLRRAIQAEAKSGDLRLCPRQTAGG
jgi:acyl-CoA synthetase (AMP-forming)/AMP-acid ligase II